MIQPNVRPILPAARTATGLFLLSAAVLLAGCGPAEARFDEPEPGWARGSVTDAGGAPLAGAEVRVEGTSREGGIVSLEVRTDSQGRYETRLADGTYTVQAYQPVTYHDEPYWIPLAPADGDNRADTDSRSGVVEDFVWKTSGRIGSSADQFHGGRVSVDVGLVETGDGGSAYPQFPAGSRIEVVLTPDGPLVDGSPGEVETFAFSPEAICATCGYTTATWNDVPVGRYTVTARLLGPAGGTTPLRVKTRRDRGPNGSSGGAITTEYAPSATLQFPPYHYAGLQSGVGPFGVTVAP